VCFEHRWDANAGSQQTRHFMERLVANLDGGVVAYLESAAPKVLDWGCAFGEGGAVLAEAFPSARVVGLDFSRRAIEEARRRYPWLDFILADGDGIPVFDVVVTSNCLEHFDEPFKVARNHLSATSDLYIALVPYKEWPLIEEHRHSFVEESFPEYLDSFVQISRKVVDVDRRYWDGKQLLVVYASPSYLGRWTTASASGPATSRGLDLVVDERQQAVQVLAAQVARQEQAVARLAQLLAERTRRSPSSTRRSASLATWRPGASRDCRPHPERRFP